MTKYTCVFVCGFCVISINASCVTTEGEYAYKLGKKIMPVLMERKYIPTGWLGALVGTKLHIDFTKDTFDNQMAKLLREMTRLLGQNTEGTCIV